MMGVKGGGGSHKGSPTGGHGGREEKRSSPGNPLESDQGILALLREAEPPREVSPPLVEISLERREAPEKLGFP